MAQTLPSTGLSDRFINVNEIFGPTIQGEGPHTGAHVGFVRLAGCNLSCSWCDTPYSWDWSRYDRAKEVHRMTAAQVAEQINPMNTKRLIITGGEPMSQRSAIIAIAEATGCLIDVETNGTKAPTPELEAVVDLFCVSPKLAHAGDPEERRIVPEALKQFSLLAKQGKAIFKFVVKTEDDFAEIDDFANRFEIGGDSIWIMPEGANLEDHLNNARALADAVIAKGWNLSLRSHVIIWSTERAK